MASENEQIKKDEENKDAPKPEHQENWIERALDHIDDEFPLSGGETDEDLTLGEEEEHTPEEIAAKKKLLDEKLNVEYPLSGGETDEGSDT